MLNFRYHLCLDYQELRSQISHSHHVLSQSLTFMCLSNSPHESLNTTLEKADEIHTLLGSCFLKVRILFFFFFLLGLTLRSKNSQKNVRSFCNIVHPLSNFKMLISLLVLFKPLGSGLSWHGFLMSLPCFLIRIIFLLQSDNIAFSPFVF